MNLKDRILIFSVFKNGLSNDENLERYIEAKIFLQDNDIDFVELEGMYNGFKELSFLVHESNRPAVEWLAWGNDQECYLESYTDRFTELVYQNGKRIGIGYLTPVTEEHAKKLTAWSYRPDIKQYYAIGQ